MNTEALFWTVCLGTVTTMAVGIILAAVDEWQKD